MDRGKETTFIIKKLNNFQKGLVDEFEYIKSVCSYFDKIKNEKLSVSDLKFLRYLANSSGIPHYYDLLLTKFNRNAELLSFNLNTLSSLLYESSLHVDENIKIHKYQGKVLKKFQKEKSNRVFLSATTSFGKTFLIYEIIKKMKYKNVMLIFPTIALLSENFEKLIVQDEYKYFHDNYDIHTLSEVVEFAEKNIFLFTPERYLSFIDKNPRFRIDFMFVDEIYKIDNEYLIDAISKENERDVAYRVALHHITKNTSDILLVGPYIEFPKTSEENQSFNVFLDNYRFEIIDFNKCEIVNKSSHLIKSGNISIDDSLSLNLKGSSRLTKGRKVSRVVSEILKEDENVILYTKGAGTAESQAKNLISYATLNGNAPSDYLSSFINHLKDTFKYSDWIVIKALSHRIGIHHGLVPKYIQKEIISLFNKGVLNVLISTTTITEGVNTSAKNLIVLNSMKGNKKLKKFDAKNIAGRAGRFLHHFSGRILIMDKKFQEILDGEDDPIKHKNYDKSSIKDEVDYFITEKEFMSEKDVYEKQALIKQQSERGIPDEVMSMYKVIPHSDKITVFDNIKNLDSVQKLQVKELISAINRSLSIDYNGMKVVLNMIYPIVNNSKLSFLIENESLLRRGPNKGGKYPTLIYMLSAYLDKGFMGSVEYNLTRKANSLRNFNIDEAVRDSSSFIFNTLKYQLVKYLGVFNIMYKSYYSLVENVAIDAVPGLDRLLLKLEYNATTEKARLASDYGVPPKIIEYYDKEESRLLIDKFDQYELQEFHKVESIFND